MKASTYILISSIEHGLITGTLKAFSSLNRFLHSDVDRDYYDLTNTIASAGVSPIIRIPDEKPWMIKVSYIPLRYL